MNKSDRYRLWFGGIAGGSFVAVTQLLTRDALSVPQKVAIGCFAVTLPLATCFLVSAYVSKTDQVRTEKVRDRIASAGSLVTMVFVLGIGALFLSFGALIGLLFIGGIALAAAFDRWILNPLQNSSDGRPRIDKNEG